MGILQADDWGMTGTCVEKPASLLFQEKKKELCSTLNCRTVGLLKVLDHG